MRGANRHPCRFCLPPLDRYLLPAAAAFCRPFNRVSKRLLKWSGKSELTLRSHNPFSRSVEVRMTPSGRSRIGSGNKTVRTVPSCCRRRVNVEEQTWQSQKYSTRSDLEGRSSGSLSRRKSLPCLRERNEAEHDGLLHLATIAPPHHRWNIPSVLPISRQYGDVGHPAL